MKKHNSNKKKQKTPPRYPRPREKRRSVSHERLESSAPARVATAATDALPGTTQKIEVLCRRASLRQELHAPGDVISDPTRALSWERRGKFFVVKGVESTGNEDGFAIAKNSSEESFGDRLLRLRRARDWGLKMLARRSGLSAPVLSQYENGDRFPGFHALIRLADALDVTTDELCGRRKPWNGKEGWTP